MLPILLSKMPSGVSTKTISQFVQSIKRGGTFQRFDHGEDLNYKLYGTKRPPKYDLKKVKTPVYIIYSMYDWFSNHTVSMILTGLYCFAIIFKFSNFRLLQF